MRKESGIIYELGYEQNGQWQPFYVGETNNKQRRLGEHKSSARSTPPKQKVYEYIQRQPEGFEWEMRQVGEFGPESDDSEDEHIMKNLYDGFKLQNVKKGNPAWMAQREEEAADMRKRGVRSYKQYRQIISDEALAAKQAKWIEEQEMIARAQAELTERERRRQELIDQQIKAGEQMSLERERLERMKRIKEKQAEERRLADAAARQQRIKEETERLQAEEAIRREQINNVRDITGYNDNDSDEALDLKSQIKLLGGYLQTISTMWDSKAKHAYSKQEHDAQINYVENRIRSLKQQLEAL